MQQRHRRLDHHLRRHGLALEHRRASKAVEPHLAGEEYFLANYGDGLTDLDLNRYIEEAQCQAKAMSFLSVRPALTFHLVSADDDGRVRDVTPMTEADIWINGGYFLCRQRVFQYLDKGEDLVGADFLAVDR